MAPRTAAQLRAELKAAGARIAELEARLEEALCVGEVGVTTTAERSDPIAPYVAALKPFALRDVVRVWRARGVRGNDGVDVGIGLADIERAIELVEAWEKVRRDEDGREELIQVAAMAVAAYRELDADDAKV